MNNVRLFPELRLDKWQTPDAVPLARMSPELLDVLREQASASPLLTQFVADMATVLEDDGSLMIERGAALILSLLLSGDRR